MSISNKDHLRISIVKLVIDGDVTLLVSSGKQVIIDPNAEPWPERWHIESGADGSSILVINA